MKRKTQSGANLIIWIGVLASVLLGVVWFIRSLTPMNADVDTITTDVLEIRKTLLIANQSLIYSRNYNPITEYGSLTINGTSQEICINASIVMCRNLDLNFTIPYIEIPELRDVIYIVISKELNQDIIITTVNTTKRIT
jgi:hypothetical protein